MSNSSFMNTIKKNYHYLANFFVKGDSSPVKHRQLVQPRPRRRNAFNMSSPSRSKFRTLLAQKDTIIKLISLYQQYNGLWDPNSPDYKNSKYTENAWERIAEQLDENIPVMLVKKKIHALRELWELETSRIKQSIEDDNEMFPPKLFFSRDFQFLHSTRSEVGSEISNLECTPTWYKTIHIEHRSESNTDPEDAADGCSTSSDAIDKNSDRSSSWSGSLNSMSMSRLTNKTMHITNLCEVIRIDLETTNSYELFFEAKWRILDVLRDMQLKQHMARDQKCNAELVSETPKGELI